jgi:cation-transporting ATPase E
MRYNPDINKGLTIEQVKELQRNNLVNIYKDSNTKTILNIILSNFFTLFNLLNLFLALLVFIVGSYKNTLFLGVVICNTLISTIQEIKSKIIIDKLKVVSQDKVTVIRNGKTNEINFDELVLDDIYILKSGNQIVTDSIIMEGNIEVSESFITGETDLISYKKGDLIKSGSFVVSGSCKAKVEHIKEENYVNTIAIDAKYVKKVESVLLKSLNKIIKIISILIIPIGILLFLNQYRIDNNISLSIIKTVAALIGMIPEGLILLTSTVLAVSIIRLSKINVLAQDLYSIEMLARIDTICLDKTGTITDVNMEVIDVVKLKDYNILEIMGNLVNNMEINNATSKALDKYFKKYDNYKLIEKYDFSPNTKYSGAKFENGTFLIGAYEFICDSKIKQLDNYKSNRVIVLCKKEEKNVPIALIILSDSIRKNVVKTLEYLKKQNISIKIISGDGIDNVSSIAKQINMDFLNIKDLSKVELNDDVILNNNIFVRATPLQKKKIIEVLQNNNHTVAMAGDGVNDVLALKQSDCGITIKSGTESSKNVSEIIILDDDFNTIPFIIKEGRRSINNLQRSATLFLNKTGYSFLLALIFMFVNFKYPFEPIQLTLTSVFTIGIPSFILALEPNNEKIKGNFLINVLSKSIPCSLTIVLNIIILSIIGSLFKLSHSQISTLCVIMTGFTGFLLLFKICIPLNKLRLFLIITLILGFILSIVGLRTFYSLTLLNLKMFIFIICLVTMSILIFNIMNILVDKIIKKYPKLFL